jgi:hypothetical protein
MACDVLKTPKTRAILRDVSVWRFDTPQIRHPDARDCVASLDDPQIVA